MSDAKHVVLIHGTWCRGGSWGPTRAAFEERGYTVHTPTLRHHELPLREGAMKIAPLSMRDYTDDLVALVDSLDVATAYGGAVVGWPAGAASGRAHPSCGRRSGMPGTGGRDHGEPHDAAQRGAPRRKALSTAATVGQTPVSPDWERFRRSIANTQTEEIAREFFADLVCESGRAYCELPSGFWTGAKPPPSTSPQSPRQCW